MVRGPDATHSAVLHEMVAQIRAKAETAWKRWDVVDREQIYHYTSVDAAFSILNDQVLWSSDVLSMNDCSEFRYAVSIVHDVLMSRWNKLPIQVAEYFCPRKLLRIGSTWNMFAACFCSESDLLGQWRAYACDGQGVAIGFRQSYRADPGISMQVGKAGLEIRLLRYALVRIDSISETAPPTE